MKWKRFERQYDCGRGSFVLKGFAAGGLLACYKVTGGGRKYWQVAHEGSGYMAVDLFLRPGVPDTARSAKAIAEYLLSVPGVEWTAGLPQDIGFEAHVHKSGLEAFISGLSK